MAAEKVQRKSHSLSISDRSQLRAGGVARIDYFSPEAVVAKTDYGNMSIKGGGLYVDSLNAETGELLVRGRIDSVAYFEHEDGKSWLKRLFR